jgi:capsule biosynthesis phosphatase
MNTYNGNVGLITANTAKTLLAWLERHDVPFDELHVGKPWPGRGGFYVDDKAIRPDEFLKLSYEEIVALVGAD